MMAIGFPVVLLDGLLGRVRFYERCLVERRWNGRRRRINYSEVRTVSYDPDTRVIIFPIHGEQIEIKNSDADLDLIDSLVRGGEMGKNEG